MKKFFFLMLVTLSFTAAAQSPEDQRQVSTYNNDMCVEKYKDRCVNSICLTSDATDCIDNCLKMSKDKCNVKSASDDAGE